LENKADDTLSVSGWQPQAVVDRQANVFVVKDTKVLFVSHWDIFIYPAFYVKLRLSFRRQ
jgi:hypothetical protein